MAIFEIDQSNLPFVPTRSALLVLDLQNDIVSTGGPLQVDTPPNFVENIVHLSSHVRPSGSVFWVRSVYEASRSVNNGLPTSDKVVTDADLVVSHRVPVTPRPKLSQKLIGQYSRMAEIMGRGADTPPLEAEEEEEEPAEETFLTVEPGHKPRIVLPESTGADFTHSVGQAVREGQDVIFQKSHYSAFKDGTLVQMLRAKFVTELYICGALTNISVFATAMDAARFGYSITIVDDCLGYRSQDRHEEALRQMIEFTGCDTINSADLITDLQRKSQRREAPARNIYARPNRPRPREKPKESSLEALMSSLNIKPEPPKPSQPGLLPPGMAPDASSSMQGTPASSGSRVSSELSENINLLSKPAEPKKREWVKNKIRTRRREAGSSSKRSPSPTSATLSAASQALEKLSRAVEDAMPDRHIGSEQDATSDTLVSKAAQQVDNTSNERVDQRHSDVEQVADAGKNDKAPVNDLEPDDKIKKVVLTEDHSKTQGPHSNKTKADAGPPTLCEGDTTVIHNLLAEDMSKKIFEKIRDEVRWQRMSHQGGEVPRLVAVQGEVAQDGSMPIYRHPLDESPPLLPFSKTVSRIRDEVEKSLGHTVNHVLIQFYRDGNDHISEHSDKTLDVVPNSFIANVSLGAQRTMVFRTKKIREPVDNLSKVGQPRQTCRAPLPHNSMCKVGLKTNEKWLHGIRQDKRLMSERSEAELAYNGARISLTFRMIGTFLDKDQQNIWGQGAVAKTRAEAQNVLNGNTPEAERMLKSFGQENQSSNFDWAEHYGQGFNVLHISNLPKLHLSGNFVADLRVKFMLNDYGIAWSEGSLSSPFYWKDGNGNEEAPSIPGSLPVRFVDNDLSKSTTTGDLAIMLYLEAVYGTKSGKPAKTPIEMARQYTRFQKADDLLNRWQAVPFSVKPYQQELAVWEAFAMEGAFIAGDSISLADYAFLPVLNEIGKSFGPRPESCRWDYIYPYWKRMNDLESLKMSMSHDEAMQMPGADRRFLEIMASDAGK